MKTHGTSMDKTVEIDLLCMKKDLRQQRLCEQVIQEIIRLIGEKGIKQVSPASGIRQEP
jgi:Myristoyl-CoA:protein N-myristoyltransferase, N-terminal domain